MPENPIRHDYTHDPSRNTWHSGWAVMDFDFLCEGKAKITAFGLKERGWEIPLEEKYLLPGEEVVISMPDGEVLYEISKIDYLRDPYDLYKAELKYVQHLTGLRCVSQTGDARTHARQLEWARQRYEREMSEQQNKPDRP